MTYPLQKIIQTLKNFWQQQGCLLSEGLDLPVGAGTFHPDTFLRALGPEPWASTYVQRSRRPTDGRYGDNPNRVQMHHQLQVVLKPVPDNIQALYLQSLAELGIDPLKDDIRFVEDNWESPTLGAWGLGWEVWQNGMEVTQFTYFQQVGSIPCQTITGEITYGLERLALHLQQVDSIYDLIWSDSPRVTYRDLFLANEQQCSAYNFEHAPIADLKSQFEQYEASCTQLLSQKLPLPAYEQALMTSHLFNLLDARQALSNTERQQYILKIRSLSQQVAHTYLAQREEQNFPLLRTH